MKRKEVIIGKAMSVFILVATIIVHNYVVELPHGLRSFLVTFSALLFTLCTIGDIRRKKQEMQ